MNYRTACYKVRRTERVINRVEKFGIKVERRRELVKMTDIVSNGGRLIDAKCHYRQVTRVSGNTYPARDILKQLGYKWNPAGKCWEVTGMGTGIYDALLPVTL
jgi:hypothetical protein